TMGDRPSAAEVSAQVHVTTRGQEYRLEYRADRDGTQSRRVLTLDSCEAVTEASALLLLLTIDPILADTMGATQLVDGAEAEVQPAPSDVAPAEDSRPEALPDALVAPTPTPAPRRDTPRDDQPTNESREPTKLSAAWLGLRSEERRVGQESRAAWG